MRRLLLVPALLLGLLAGCANADEDPVPVAGSTYRIAKPVPDPKSELTIRVFQSEKDCKGAGGMGAEEAKDCRPLVDRATGQVRLGFQLQDTKTGNPYYLPLSREQIQVSHMGTLVNEPGKTELIPHRPIRSGQLFILLIDGSGSMYENDQEQIRKLYDALLSKNVIKSFYPDDFDVRTGVVALRFTGRVKGLDGGEPTVLKNPKQYTEFIRQHLIGGERGYTHLYDAVQYGMTDLLETDGVKKWLQINQAEPTVIALTDGFNNEAPDDSCATNAPRLQKTLEKLLQVRTKSLLTRPRLYTVGLGKPLFRNFEVPPGDVTVTASKLCGKYAKSRIDGSLETIGIDNASMAWMASVGGGNSFTKNNKKGLAEVFRAAAALRYEWYEIRYEVDGFYHRTSFPVKLSLLNFAFASTSVTLHPSGWLDAPTGVRAGAEKWVEPAPLRHTASFAMPLLGLLVFGAFLGPASFNARRAIFRRARGKRK